MSNKSHVSADEKIELGKEAVGFSNLLLGGGVVLLGAGVALGFSDTENMFRSYVVAVMYLLSIGLGLLWFVTINHLVNAKWVIVVRRVAEILAAQMPVVFLFALGIVIPMALADGHAGERSAIQQLYVWLHDATVHADHLLHHKSPYLNKGFFLVRIAVYFTFWVGLSLFFLRRSVAQDKTTSKAESQAIAAQLRRVAAPAMIGFALTLTFCAFDMLMSLTATWFSTIFGVYYFAGCVLSGYSTLALVLMWVQRQGRLKTYVNENHFHDLGKIMFGFVVFWSYIGFAQFMLIWYADIPEETFWFKRRFIGDWRVVSTILLVCHFLLPFIGLLSRHVKRSRVGLAFWAVWLLSMQFVDLYWLVFPKDESGHAPIALSAPLFVLGGLALFLGAAIRRAQGINLVPTKDPRLQQSLAFENY
jgi:hypothetical protein